MRLKYRYLDLRRDVMQKRLRLRHQVTRAMRAFLDAQGFIDIETPMLTKATPEGARDYLVPSRTHPGQFFALPQSPQLFKQLLMMSGFDRYYQIVRCFRDEDLRAERQPEFTQLDIETSFMSEGEIMQLMEELIRSIFKTVLGAELPNPFPRMTYAEAMRRYASDKPDLRIPLELVDVADLVRDCEFKVFAGPAANPNGRVAALRVPQGGQKMTRKEIDDCTAFVGRYGAKGLAYVKVNEKAKGRDGLQSPILKFLSDDAIDGVLARTAAEDGDLIFFGADTAKVVNDSLGALRIKIGDDLGLVQTGWRPLWVVDFPMFEWDADAKRWMALHHPFTAPRERRCGRPARRSRATRSPRAYDMVLNGSEIGGGSVRIHRQEMQSTVFDLLGISAEEAQNEVRLPARSAEVRYAAARRHRVRARSHRHVHGRHRQHPRRHRVPEDADRGRSDDECADGRERGAAQRAAYPGEAAGEGGLSVGRQATGQLADRLQPDVSDRVVA